jgi:ABC-type uncharacterized transport system involved in gliding motility auxiliary subunit
MNKASNILGSLGTAAVVVSLVLRFQTYKIEWQQYSWWAAVIGLVLVLLYIAMQWREVATSFSHRQTRLGTIAVSSVLIVLGILVAVNYLANRRNHRWDLTANKQFSLSDQTRQILHKLDAPVKVTVWDRPNQFDAFRDRLDEYQYLSNGKLNVEYLSPDKNPVRANQEKVQTYGTVVFTYKNRQERVTGSDEQQLTNTLIKVITGEERKVYFTQGHGERDTVSSGREGYSAIVQALGSENYKVEPLPLAQKPEVPADAAVVVVAGPTTDLLQPEVDALKTYLAGGGKLLVLTDPPGKPGAPPLTNLESLAKEWGFQVGNDMIVDTSGVGQLLGANEITPVAVRYPSHPITERFRVITAYPMARSVRPAEGGEHTPQTFIESSPNSWAETNLADLFAEKPVEFDKDKDLQGPVSMGAAVSAPAANAPAPPKTDEKPGEKAPEPPRGETRVAVIGDSDFAANGFLGIQGNRDMFLNTVSWLSQQENLISIRPHEADDRRLTLTSDQQRLLTWGTVLVIPAAIFFIGFLNWRRRG